MRVDSKCPICHGLGDLFDRIECRYVIDGNECHNWTGTLTKDGYALLSFKNKKTRAAKAVLEKKLNRKIEKGKETCHTCNNRKCINPEHLYEGTHKQNALDMAKAGSVRGVKNGQAKIPESLAIKIKKQLKKNVSVLKVAEKYSVPIPTVRNIKRNKTWAWLEIENKK